MKQLLNVYIKRMDILVKGALIAAVCVHWFNPLVWVMLVLCNRDLELSCDEAVIRKFGKDSCKEYAYTLLGFEERRRGLSSLTSGFSKNAIEERIKSIMKLKKLSVFAIIAAVLLIAVVFVVFATSSKKDDDVPGGFETGDVETEAPETEPPVTEPNDKTPIPLKRYNLDSGKSWLSFYAGENWEYADYTFTENSKLRMTLCDPLYAVDEFQDILESDIAVQYDFSSKITGATINGDSYVGYAGVTEDGNIVYAFYFCDNYGSTLEVKLWQYSHIDESDYFSTTVMSIIDSFSISENYSIKIRDTVVNLEGRELRLELSDNSLTEFSALISEMVGNYDEYADVSAILVGDMKFTIVLSKQSSGAYCYAVSVSANGSEKLFPELLQLGEGYSIEFAETDLGIALGQTKNGIGNWWVYTDSGVREATD